MDDKYRKYSEIVVKECASGVSDIALDSQIPSQLPNSGDLEMAVVVGGNGDHPQTTASEGL